MAINKNHLFDDLNGVKCAIVESNISESRAAFLKSLLEFNKFTVVIVPEAPAKAPTPPPAPVTTEPGAETAPVATAPAAAPEPQAPTAFKIGVTDVSFNVTNAIFGRLLHTKDKRVVTMAYWLQKEEVSHDEIPYYDRKF
jgi:hypothetical protein